MLNGHEYVAYQARKGGIDFTKPDNCFTSVTNAADLAQIADTLSRDETAGRLRQLCERWIYTACLCFALDLKEQERSTFQYQYSVFQMEYSRNLLFQSGRQMDEVFQASIDRTRGRLDLDRVKTIFGDKKRPHYDRRKKNAARWGVVVEKPTYDLTVFKVHYGKMTLKIYTKGARVLRSEVIVHNTKEYHGCLLRQRRHPGKSASAGTSRSNQGGWNRPQQTQNAPGSGGRSGVVYIPGRIHGFRPGTKGP